MSAIDETKSTRVARPLRLHVGSGDKRLAGWVNVDLLPLPGVDVVADVTKGLDFEDVDAIFAEHFLEHLALDSAIDFLVEAHRALRPGAWIRLSTPNLDWVWTNLYARDGDPDRRIAAALDLNRAFRAWGHQFLWNRELLDSALAACGFAARRFRRYGESELDFFRGLERHETYVDTPDLPHVLIVEARKGEPAARELAALRSRVQREFMDHLEARFEDAVREARDLRRAIVEIRSSPSFRLGRAITAPARWLRGALRASPEKRER